MNLVSGDFEKAGDGLIRLIPDYIDSQRTRLYIKNSKSNSQDTFQKEVNTIYVLCLFYVSLTEGDYLDRTQVIPKMEYNVGYFWKYLDVLVDGLHALNLKDDATFMKQHFTNNDLPDYNSRELESRFWNESYQLRICPDLTQYIRSYKTELLILQSI